MTRHLQEEEEEEVENEVVVVVVVDLRDAERRLASASRHHSATVPWLVLARVFKGGQFRR